eukprot:UN04405
MAAGHVTFFLTFVLAHLCTNGYLNSYSTNLLPMQECIIKSSREISSIIIKHLVRLYNLYNRYFIWYIGLFIEFFINLDCMALPLARPHYARVPLGKERNLSGWFYYEIIRILHKNPWIIFTFYVAFYTICRFKDQCE